jgi:tetratricopeptide (TPR) repeat protein
MTNKRISRSRKRELAAPDEFLTFSGKLIKFFVENKTKIIASGATFLALILVLSGFRYYSVQTEKKAFALLDGAMGKYRKSMENKDPAKAYGEVKKDFEAILEKYSGNRGGKIAKVEFADICFSAGEFDRAIEMYKQSLQHFEKYPYYRFLILNGLAYAYEQKKDYSNAIKYFEILKTEQDKEPNDDVLFNLSRLYAANNDHAKEKEYYKKIISDFPDSIYIDIAKEKVGDGVKP